MTRRSILAPLPHPAPPVAVVVFAPDPPDLPLCRAWAHALGWNVVAAAADSDSVVAKMRDCRAAAVLGPIDVLTYDLRRAVVRAGGALHAAVAG